MLRLKPCATADLPGMTFSVWIPRFLIREGDQASAGQAPHITAESSFYYYKPENDDRNTNSNFFMMKRMGALWQNFIIPEKI